jgi:hypothetical protein
MFYHYSMPRHSGFFTKALTQTITAIELMASPNGTTIAELTKRLSLTRRSVFRLIKTIEQDINIPIIINRNVFGGVSTYRLPSGFVERFSHAVTPSLRLSFHKAIMFYMIFEDDIIIDTNETQNK